MRPGVAEILSNTGLRRPLGQVGLTLGALAATTTDEGGAGVPRARVRDTLATMRRL